MEKESLLNQTRLDGFILLSFILHLIVIVIQGILPAHVSTPPPPPPIKVKYIEPKKPESFLKSGTIIDAPKPKKIEKPRTSELLSSHDSRAHSNREKTAVKKYVIKKKVIPKARGSLFTEKLSQASKTKSVLKSPSRKTAIKKEAPLLPLSDKGILKPTKEITEHENRSAASSGSRGAVSILDGFDAQKYASLGPQTPEMEESDDDEPVSLDTTETKYASYFARIKYQIQRVWSYPIEAAQRGISGEVTISFKISRDGNLLNIRSVNKSKHEVLDLSAIKAIKEAAPFYPFPVTIEKDKISIMATFIYTPTYSNVDN